MKFTRYGYGTIRFFLIISLLIDLAAFMIDIVWLKVTLVAVSILLMIFVLNFFRDPQRTLPPNITDDTLISPADGRIVEIKDIMYTLDAPFPKGEKLKQVSIFLSAFNVHVNRIPVSGVVNFINYVKGEYLVAFDHKSSDRNERSELGIKSVTGKQVVFKQIAGFVARRIIYELNDGQSVIKGERFGMIKFGSRVDILFHPDAKIFVNSGDKVTAGETIICEL